MKKIALLSEYNVENYGTYLQTYAMLKSLQKLNFDVKIIKYDKKSIIKQLMRVFNIPLLSAKMKVIYKKFYSKVINKELNKYFIEKSEKFKEFKNENFVFSDEIKDYRSLVKYVTSCDYVIVGSDQVWNPMNLGKDYYTMNFVPENVKKISYASSFGVSEIPKTQILKTKKYLSRIDCLSTREEAGKKIIKNLINREAMVVADPTILIDKTEWDKFIIQGPIIKEPYIFCYLLGDNIEHRQFIDSLSKKTGLKTIALPHCDEIVKSDFNFFDFVPEKIGPKEFVNLIAYASYVCTDSFHGTVFSILFKREFFTFKRFNNIKSSTNSRIESLLIKMNLEERLISKNYYMPEYNKINYENVKEKINELRNISIEYLRKSLDIN